MPSWISTGLYFQVDYDTQIIWIVTLTILVCAKLYVNCIVVVKFSVDGNFLPVSKLQNTSRGIPPLFTTSCSSVLPLLFTNQIYASTVIPISPEMKGNDFLCHFLKNWHDYKAKKFAKPRSRKPRWYVVHLQMYLQGTLSLFTVVYNRWPLWVELMPYLLSVWVYNSNVNINESVIKAFCTRKLSVYSYVFLIKLVELFIKQQLWLAFYRNGCKCHL